MSSNLTKNGKELLRKLTIKANTAKRFELQFYFFSEFDFAKSRIQKEYLSYQDERNKQVEKVEEMKKTNADSYDIKKQEEVLAECEKMIPDAQQRLQSAYDDLLAFLVHIFHSIFLSERLLCL